MDRNRVARAVGLIAWGYLLLCFHLTVGTIVLVPNWLCYIFFLKAMGGLEPVVPAVKLLFPLGVLLGVWEGLLWGMSAVRIQDFTLLYGLQLVASVLMIYFHFQFLTNLAEIAAQVGYEHVSYFNFVFKKMEGMTPHPYAVYHSHGAPDCLDGGLSSGGCTWNCRCGDWNLYLRGFVWPAESIEKRRPAATAGDGKVETEAF